MSEFIVTSAISATFVVALGTGHIGDVAGLIVGGVLAAPIAASVVHVAPARVLMGLVGVIVIALSGWQLLMAFESAWRPLWSLTPPWLQDLIAPR